MLLQVVGTKLRVLGTLHVFPVESTLLPAWVESAYAWADRLASEHSPPQLFECASIGEGCSLQALIGSEAWGALGSRGSSDQDMALLDSLKPWAAMLVVMTQALGCAFPGVEQILLPREGKRGRPVDMIETGAEVAQLFDEVSPDVWRQVIAELPGELEIRRHFEDLYDAWIVGDLEGLRNVRPPNGREMNPHVQRVMFEERNKRWAKRIKTHDFSGQKTLLLVGALHLVGARNLIDCLRAEGLAVTKVEAGVN